MGQFLPFLVESASDEGRGLRQLGEFRRLAVAIRAAKLALEDERVSLAVVKNRDGVMVFCADRRREWSHDTFTVSAIGKEDRVLSVMEGEARFGPTEQQLAISKMVDSLHAVTDGQLEVLVGRHWSRAEDLTAGFVDEYGPEGAWLAASRDPICRVEFAFEWLVASEAYRRAATLVALEADLRGGHRVEVCPGDAPARVRAICDPRPDTVEFCWVGPDRTTIEQAAADGRRHHPGHEPEISEGALLGLGGGQ